VCPHLVLSLLTRGTAWVDRLWSIIRWSTGASFGTGAGLATPRLDVMFGWSAVGGRVDVQLRAGKGGYCGRRARTTGGGPCGPGCGRSSSSCSTVLHTIYQNVILHWICLPASRERPATRAVAGEGTSSPRRLPRFLVGETIADQQQWNFHQWERAETGRRDPGRRFLADRTVPLLAAPNFFFSRPVVGSSVAFGASRPVRPGRDGPRRGAADPAFRRVDGRFTRAFPAPIPE